MDSIIQKSRLTKEQKLILADQTTERAVAETDGDRRYRDEKTARLRALRLAQEKQQDI